MRNFIKSVAKSVAVITLVFGVNASAAVVEGKDYQVLEKPIANAQGTVIKVFSYACPFCYKYDKSVVVPVMKKVPNMKFMPYHLSTKGVFGIYGSELLATMIVIDENAGVDLLSDNSKFKKAKFALYDAYHNKKERWGADANVKANVDAFLKVGLDAVGMSMDEYNKAKEDPKVKELVNRWGVDNTGDAYMIAKIQGVPAFIVNGKYLIITKSIRGIDSMAETINELSKLN